MSRLFQPFRSHQRAMWQQVCEEIDADFIPGKGLLGKDAIQAYHENWTIIIDIFRKPKQPPITRIRAPYINRDSFRFRIHRSSAASSVAKIFGMQDILVGHPDFDKAFIIQGNDERKLRMLFSNRLVRQLIGYQPRISLEIKLDEQWVTDDFQEGISELYLEAPGIITDIDHLKELYDLFAEILSHLCHIGSAYEDDPFLLNE